MSDLHLERRHVSNDDMHCSASIQLDGATRHSRFSWWQMEVTAARSSIKDDCRPSLDASSSYSTASRRASTAAETSMPARLKPLTPKPTLKAIVTHMRADSTDSDDLDSPIHPINIDDWPTPPTSAISPTPSTTFSYSQLPWKTHASSIATTTPTSRVSTIQSPRRIQPSTSQPVQRVKPIKPAQETSSSGQPLTPQKRPGRDKPNIPEKSSARKSANFGLLEQAVQAEDPLLQCQLDQLRSEVRTLRYKSSFLEETLKQTVHHRIALYAERESISPSSSLLTLPILSPDANVIERGRPVSRSGYLPTDAAFWEARAPSALDMVPETERPSTSTRPQSPTIRAIQSAVEIKHTPPSCRREPVLSIMPNLVAIPMTRPPSAPVELGLRRSASLPRLTTVPAEARPPTRAMPEAKAWQPRLAEEVAKNLKLNKIIELWRGVGKKS